MKKTLIFWICFLLLGVGVFAAAAVVDNVIKRRGTSIEKIKEESIIEDDLSCLKEHLERIKPFTKQIECDGFSYTVPLHWWLTSESICTGTNPALDRDGLNNFERRKKLWNTLLTQLGFAYIGMESVEFGGTTADFVSKFRATLAMAGMAGTSLQILNSPTQKDGIVFVIPRTIRDTTNPLLRDALYESKFTTYRNAVDKLAKILQQSDLIRNSIGAGEQGITISRDSANDMLSILLFQEFIYMVSEYIVNNQSNFDKALVEVVGEIKSKSEDELCIRVENIIAKRKSDDLVQLDESLIKLLAPIIYVGTGAVSAPVIAFGLAIVGGVESIASMLDYPTSLYLATLSYSLANSNMEQNCLTNLIKTMAILIGDKNIMNYFEPDLFKTYINILTLLAFRKEYSDGWHDIVYDDKRNADLRYLMQGYMDCGTPCRWNVRGKVVDGDDNTPIGGAKVLLLANNNQMVQETTTNANGRFGFKVDQDGVYKVRATKDGYCTEEQEVNIRNRISDPSELIMGLRKPDMSISEFNRLIRAEHDRLIRLAKYRAQGLTVVVEFENKTCRDIPVTYPWGTTFRNSNPGAQNIVLERQVTLYALANQSSNYSIGGYCISRYGNNPSGEIFLDNSLKKPEYAEVTKLAEKRSWNRRDIMRDWFQPSYPGSPRWNIDARSQVQQAMWYFSNGIGYSKGTIAEELVKYASNSKQPIMGLKVNNASAAGAGVCTVIFTLPLFFIVRLLRRIK